jgi:tRNA(Ile)-lysidine synthase
VEDRATRVGIQMLITKVAGTIQRHRMIQPGDRVLVALSGGPDSVALTHALIDLGRRRSHRFEVAAAHLNHQLRPESDEDEAFCRDLADGLGLRFVSARADVRAVARQSRRSLEEAGRLQRYRFLESAAAQLGCTRVALGHTRNDQAETLLLRLFRGSGTAGLSAIYPVVEEFFIRPLLEVERKEIIQFLTRGRIAFRLDRSNEDRSFSRNRVRHEILPSLEKHFNPALVETLARTADLSRADEEWMAQEAARALRELSRPKEGCSELHLPVSRMKKLHPALARRVVRAAVEAVKGDLRGWSRRHVDDVLQLVRPGKSGRILRLPGVLFVRSFGEIHLRPAGDESSSTKMRRQGVNWAQDSYNEYEYELPVPGYLEIPEAGGTMRAAALPMTTLPAAKGTNVVVGLSTMKDERLKVRSPRPGDRFRPLGAAGTKSMFRYLMEQRVARDRRRNIPLVVRGNDVLWVVGHGISELSRVGPGAHRTLQLSWMEE